ncbi:MAG: cytosolic protein [Deltaproteobacteria bacterium CG_4_10_14_3_um_filter_51_14]|nr:MAG: cytosolic protein [Deltaproteobacteria bacterium CG_4_10_14_3_um_filter_51_14]
MEVVIENKERPEDMSQEDMARFVLDMFHRIAVHHTLWYMEVEHQMGMEKALKTMGVAWDQSRDIQLAKLAKFFGFSMIKGIPEPLLKMPKENLLRLADDVGKNWLANDGVWFQAVEFAHGMNDAKRCNDSTWARFSPFEAWSIRRLLDLPPRPGLDGLRRALKFRMYARVNIQSIIDDDDGSVIFRMNDCRVQSARKRKGLPDYPCKSVGLVEYAYFAEAIDPRITTECIGCPPDDHPDEWYCAWRFRLKEDQ